MTELSWAQIRGIADLLHDGVALAIDLTAQTHYAIARQPFAVLERIPLIALPATAINAIQHTITRGVYATIHAVNNGAGTLVSHTLTIVEHRNECKVQSAECKVQSAECRKQRLV